MNAPAMRLLLTLAVGLAAPAACAQEKTMPDSFAGFPGFVEQSMARWKVPGLAVAVVRDGEIVYLRGFGLRDLERQLPVTPQTLFPIGSATKSFTAAAVAMLAEQEKLDLDAPLVRYLPDFRLHDEHASRHATPRDVLLHRTGVPAYDFLWVAVPLSREEYFHRLRYLPPSRGFRESFQYSNLMYTALGVLVGRVSGGTWEEFVAARIFRPLAIRRSNFSVDQMQRSEDFAAPYARAGEKLQRIPFRQVDATGPASSINSSAEEMARWLLLHLNRGAVDGKRLLAPARVAEMHRGQIRITDPVLVSLVQASEYGLGWYVSDYRGRGMAEHAGGIDGFVALVSLLPAEKIGVVVLSNGDRTLLPYVLVRNLYDRLLGLDPVDRNAEFEKVLDDAMRAWGAGGEGVWPHRNHSRAGRITRRLRQPVLCPAPPGWRALCRAEQRPGRTSPALPSRPRRRGAQPVHHTRTRRRGHRLHPPGPHVAGRDQRSVGLNQGPAASNPEPVALVVGKWWAWTESNSRPHPYQGCALTN